MTEIERAIETLRQGKWWNNLPNDDSNLCRAIEMATTALRAQQEREEPVALSESEVRGKIGEPVWLVCEHWEGWAIVSFEAGAEIYHFVAPFATISRHADDCGFTWTAFAHKPQGGKERE